MLTITEHHDKLKCQSIKNQLMHKLYNVSINDY